jgi:putative flippase GtrA
MNELSKIFLYGVFNVVTTGLFWALEIGYWLLWDTDCAKYFGAVIGLSTGYWFKFRLDRAYTFRIPGR